MQEYDEKVEEAATEIVELVKRVERVYASEENNLEGKLFLARMLGDMNPSTLKQFPNKSELCYQLCFRNFHK